MPGPSDPGVGVSLAPPPVIAATSLEAALGPGADVSCDLGPETSVVVLGQDEAAARAATLRSGHPSVGIVVVVDELHPLSPAETIAILEAGADVCLVSPGPQSLAAHVHAVARRRRPVTA